MLLVFFSVCNSESRVYNSPSLDLVTSAPPPGQCLALTDFSNWFLLCIEMKINHNKSKKHYSELLIKWKITSASRGNMRVQIFIFRGKTKNKIQFENLCYQSWWCNRWRWRRKCPPMNCAVFGQYFRTVIQCSAANVEYDKFQSDSCTDTTVSRTVQCW